MVIDGDNLEGPAIFEGIATVDVDGVAHDAYLSAFVEGNDTLVRWYGRFEWMGEAPKGVFHGEFLDAVLSDGRECKIYVPNPSTDGGKMDFLGQGLPPGFQPLYTKAVLPQAMMELASTTPPRWRVWLSRLYAILAFALMVAAIWVDDHRWELVITGLLFSLVSIQLTTPARGRPLKEVKSDDD